MLKWASELIGMLNTFEIKQFFSASFVTVVKSSAFIPGTEAVMDK